jgi:hypothetical protein
LRIDKENGEPDKRIQAGKGQTQTLARYKALTCVRLAVQQAVVVEACMGDLPDQNKWNVDGSTMLIEDLGKGALMYRVVSCSEADKHEEAMLKDPLTSIRWQTGLDMGLKVMFLANGNGDFGRMCLIFAVPGMPEGRFFFAKVKGLVFGEDSSKYGCVYFSRTRCMKGLPGKEKETVDDENRPINAWAHYFTNVFAEDISYYADSYDTRDPETGLRYDQASSIDGESVIDREFMDPTVWETLDKARIRVFKNRPSGTQYDNPHDASDNFRDKNTGLKECVTKCKDTYNGFLHGTLTEAFKAMRAAYPCVTMSAAHQDKAIDGAMRFVYVCKAKYMSPIKAIEGFRRSFHVRRPNTPLPRPILGRENSTVDAYSIMRYLCHTTIEPAAMDVIMTHFPEFIDTLKTNARLTNEVLDKYGVCKLPEGEHKDRDALCLQQAGPCILTHAETRRREEAWAKRKETLAAEKVLEDARALVAKEQEKAAATAASAAEKLRVAGLSAEEKKTDPILLQKAEAAKETKRKAAVKKGKEAEKLAAARELVAAHGY